MSGFLTRRSLGEGGYSGVGNFNYRLADELYLMNGTERPPDNAQNWYRHQLAELGLLGSAGWIVWVGMFLWLLVRRHGPEDKRALVGAAKGAAVGLGVASLLGMPSQDTAVSISFVVLACWCLKLTGAERLPDRGINASRNRRE